jgi:ABC-type branched-subunit amino acid transport system ATPase component
MTAEQTIMSLILDSLEIKNFRAFKHLRIEKLGRVNLIVGKNNVGKSSVLEALWLYASGTDPAVVWSILSSRDENGTSLSPIPSTEKERVNAARALFHGRKSLEEVREVVQVGPYQPGPQNKTFSIYVSEFAPSDENYEEVKSRPEFDGLEPLWITDLALFAKTGSGRIYDYPLNPDEPRVKRYKTDYKNQHFVYIPASGLTALQISNFWDAIALTSLEDDVLSAISLLDADIERIGMVGSNDSFTRRYAIVKVRQSSDPFPFRSMGEGMNRMFGIALALVNAKDGMLLIDEVDTGLHYSVLPDLWRLIFEVAHRLNVQVFATSHSWDCIQAFQQAADANTEEEGMLIRLEHRDGDVVPVMFDERKLNIAAREQIEVR